MSALGVTVPQMLSVAADCFWHKADILPGSINVRFEAVKQTSALISRDVCS